LKIDCKQWSFEVNEVRFGIREDRGRRGGKREGEREEEGGERGERRLT
jgi:hypothetical protein